MTTRKIIPPKSGPSAKRIVVAETGSDAMDLLDDLLPSAEFEVIPASAGREAFSLAVQLQPDLIAIRICLPDISSAELCRALFVHSLTADIDVLLFNNTANLLASIRRRRPDLARYLRANPAVELREVFENMHRHH